MLHFQRVGSCFRGAFADCPTVVRFQVSRVIVLILVVLGFVVVIGQRHTLEKIPEAVAALGAWAPAVCIMLYAVLASALFPAALLTVAAGAVFGLGIGTLVSSLGSTFGAALAFLVARYLAREWIESKVLNSRRFAAVDRAVTGEGWRIVALTRLSPIFPYGLLNYGFGITGVRFWPYVLASWMAMLPGTLLYVFIGTLGRSLVEEQELSNWHRALYAIGLAATVLVVMLVARVARRVMRELVDGEHGAEGGAIGERPPPPGVAKDAGNG